MNLMDTYNAKIRAKDIQDDASQRALLEPLNTLAEALNTPKKTGLMSFFTKKPYLQGFYLFGKVGVGKTFLLDLLYEEVNIARKKRFHFHHFMQYVDAELRALQGKKNPLLRIANAFTQSTDLLCLDEFMVEDVANAMILGELLPLLLAKGLVLVVTSNILPENLYLHGSHRIRFLPAITAIQSHCQIACLDVQKDYRLGREQKLGAYLFPLSEATDKALVHQFFLNAPKGDLEKKNLLIQKRDIPCVAMYDGVVWFEFNTLCHVPRSQLDYLEIADTFDTVLLSKVPALTERDTLRTILLIHLIDVLYDRGIRVIISAEVAINKLYVSGELAEEFKRTRSRLQEMQSEDYAKRHPKRVKCE